MPSKALFYRFLNTIIDDLFSFIITMGSRLRAKEATLTFSQAASPCLLLLKAISKSLLTSYSDLMILYSSLDLSVFSLAIIFWTAPTNLLYLA